MATVLPTIRQAALPVHRAALNCHAAKTFLPNDMHSAAMT